MMHIFYTLKCSYNFDITGP